MVFFVQLEQYQALLMAGIFIILASTFYYFSLRSRKKYKCQECKEEITIEHLTTEHCNICGAKLEITKLEK